MADKTHEHPIDVLKHYAKALKEEGITFDVSEDGIMLTMLGETTAGLCEGYLLIDEIEVVHHQHHVTSLAFCEFFYLLPIHHIPEERQAALYELVLRLNESHRIGGYEVHIEDQEIRFRVYQTLTLNTPPPREQLLMPFFEGARAIDLHWEAFQMVLQKGMDACHAVAEFYAKESILEEEEVDEALVSRAGELFEIAKNRYVRNGDENLAGFIQDRMDRFTKEAAVAVLRSAGPFPFASPHSTFFGMKKAED